VTSTADVHPARGHIDHLTDMIARLDTHIDEASLPFGPQIQLLATIPRIGERAAQVQQAQFVAAGDMLPQHRSHDVLEIVVVDSSDRLETDDGACRTSA
jgi:hypothetical protein